MNSQTKHELRDQIDSLDDQIIELLLKRIHLSNSIIKAKAPGQIVDAGREEEIHHRYTGKLATVSTPVKIKQLVTALLSASSLYP